MTKGFTHATPFEVNRMRAWHKEHKSIAEIARLLGRSTRAVSGHLKQRANARPKTKGRPKALSDSQYSVLQKTSHRLQKKANGQSEITVAAVRDAAGCTACDRTVRDAFHAHGIRFRKLREKPILTPEDVAARVVFADQYGSKTEAQWVAKPHAVIDNKHFPMYINKSGREHAARRQVRGAYRLGKSAVEPHLVKPKNTIKFPAKSATVAAAVVNGKIRMWHYVSGKWNGDAAAAMYKGPLAAALRKSFPGVSKFVVLEDNDPAGYKCSKGLAAKKAAKISAMDLPRRSPDLNVLDYSLWREINVRMRKQEAAFPKNHKESPVQFKDPLKKVALGLPAPLVRRAVGDLRRRLREVKAAKGGLINE